jgi:hypothetical protein
MLAVKISLAMVPVGKGYVTKVLPIKILICSLRNLFALFHYNLLDLGFTYIDGIGCY